jgi:hypothetical protein
MPPFAKYKAAKGKEQDALKDELSTKVKPALHDREGPALRRLAHCVADRRETVAGATSRRTS